MLLVLDTCEHLLEACRELVTALASGCAGVRVLCTSRERLSVPGEVTVVLSALELPAVDGRVPVAAVADVEALRLLADRAVAVAPGFTLTDDNCGAAGDICRRLDGLPLAIELAAVRLASMTPGDLLARLDDRFRLLAADRRAQPGRSQALRAAVDWSHDLLGPEERVLWRRLSVFAGGFGLAAAEAVCSGAGLEREQIAGLIGHLVDASILTMAHGGRHSRYRMLETVKTRSGATAVQIVHSSRRGPQDIEHIGPAHDEAGLEALKTAAQQRTSAGQLKLGRGLGVRGRLEVVQVLAAAKLSRRRRG